MDVFFVAVFLFLSGCHILIEKSAIFITKMQFLSLEDITLQFLKKNRKEERKITQNNKNATLPLYVFCLPKQNEFFAGLF